MVELMPKRLGPEGVRVTRFNNVRGGGSAHLEIQARCDTRPAGVFHSSVRAMYGEFGTASLDDFVGLNAQLEHRHAVILSQVLPTLVLTFVHN